MAVTGALAGVKVLDLSRILAGPYCTQLLADLGATVWKVESLRGDDTRRWGPPFQAGESAYYLAVNRGKRSLAIDLKHPLGRALVQRLAAHADVLVENFKTGDLKRYGLDYSRVSAGNPGVVYCSITGFGHTGPRAAEPGYDVALQGLSGIMSITGEPGGPPAKVGVAWIDVLTGLHAAVAILAALRERDASSVGQHLDMSLFDTALASLANQAQAYLMTDIPPQAMGSAHPQIVPYQAFEASDGWLILAAGNDEQFRRACRAMELHSIGEDERFATNQGRVEHRGELVASLAQRFARHDRAFWLDALSRAGVPVTPVNNVAEAFADPQAAARKLVWELPHSTLGTVRMPASPFQWLGSTPARPGQGPPRLGEHSREILNAALGLSALEVERLVSKGVVGAAAPQADPRDLG